MSMIDHVLAFANEAAAQAALPQFYNQSWDTSRVIPGISIITAEAVYSGEGMERVLVSPEEKLPGFWVAIALPELSAELRDLPDEACRLIADRAAANAGQPFVTYLAPSVDPQLIATARVSPVFAGSKYPFGG